MFNYTEINGIKRSRNSFTLSEPIVGREADMTQNHAGGYSFKTSNMQRLRRFLILGVEGNTYYQGQKELVKENTVNVQECIKENPYAVVDEVVKISEGGLSLKQEALLYVLALVASHKVDMKQPKKPLVSPDMQSIRNVSGSDQYTKEEWADWTRYHLALNEYNEAAAVRKYALSKVARVCRTPTMLFMFAEYVKDLRGWGRAVRDSFAKWYTESPIDRLAMHSWKYKQRNGWSHRDLLRLSHPKTDDAVRQGIFNYMVKGKDSSVTKITFGSWFDMPQPIQQIIAAEELLSYDETQEDDAVKLITQFSLTHEAVPTSLKNSKKVWIALLEKMPFNALVTNLGRLSHVGVLEPFSEYVDFVVNTLTNPEVVKKSRIHPLKVWIAMKTYGSGKAVKGKLTWEPNDRVLGALDTTFELAFGNVEPTNKKILLAIDVSGSMGSSSYSYLGGCDIDTIPNTYPLELAAVMAYITYKTETNVHVIGFDTRVHEIRMKKNITLQSFVKKLEQYSGGGTNTSLPLQYLMDKKLDVDAVVSYTDNETWANTYSWFGSNHFSVLFDEYSKKYDSNVKFVNCAFVATHITDVDNKNANMLELAGTNADNPRIISEFIKGTI